MSVPTTTKWIASRLIKSMRFNTTWVVYQRLPISPQALVSNPRGWITNIYPCNIIHEISHAHCSDVWQVLSVHRAFHWFWSQGWEAYASWRLASEQCHSLNQKLKAMQRIRLSQTRLLRAEWCARRIDCTIRYQSSWASRWLPGSVRTQIQYLSRPYSYATDSLSALLLTKHLELWTANY